MPKLINGLDPNDRPSLDVDVDVVDEGFHQLSAFSSRRSVPGKRRIRQEFPRGPNIDQFDGR